MADSPHVAVATAENFYSLVLEGSHQRPVLVDFWADWCAPCRTLMPVLAKLADEYRGKFLLAKVNTEEERELAASFGIRSLPTVQLFKGGQPLDQFMGALPESQVREFLERHLPRESNDLLAQVQRLLDSGDIDGAESRVDRARNIDPDNSRIHLAEVRIKAARGDLQGAEELLERLPLELLSDPEVAALKGQLRFARVIADAPPEAQLAARLEVNPKDSEARYQLAARQIARGDTEAGLKQLLDLLKKDRSFGDDAARKGMVMVFDMLGGKGDLVTRYRSQMLNALY
jgi:putative thioredoxin